MFTIDGWIGAPGFYYCREKNSFVSSGESILMYVCTPHSVSMLYISWPLSTWHIEWQIPVLVQYTFYGFSLFSVLIRGRGENSGLPFCVSFPINLVQVQKF